MKIVLLLLAVIGSFTFAQQLRVDSVTVDSIWNTDSSWYDRQGIFRQRQSRDCLLSFTLDGEGMATCSLAVSFDSGQSWFPKVDTVVTMIGISPSLFACGHKEKGIIRILGSDRQNIAFKIVARQYRPVVIGAPKMNILGIAEALVSGHSCQVPLDCRQKTTNVEKGYAPIVKVFWDALADGVLDDSTTTLAWQWQTTVPSEPSGQRRAVVVKALDRNGLWSIPETLTVQFGLQRPLCLVPISGGTFQMGSSLYLSELPIHSVTLSSYKIGQTLVTQEMFMAVMRGVNPSHFQSDTGNLRPVENINWYNAVLFCNALSKLSGKDTVYTYTAGPAAFVLGATLTGIACDTSKNGFRLPTEAEWEYACRAGSITDFYWNQSYALTTREDTARVDSHAVWVHNSNDQTWPVALKPPNAWGLYDMAGNVRQWCNDINGDYSSTVQTNPMGPNVGFQRVQRGGSYYGYDNHIHLRSANRHFYSPNVYQDYFGFRVVTRP